MAWYDVFKSKKTEQWNSEPTELEVAGKDEKQEFKKSANYIMEELSGEGVFNVDGWPLTERSRKVMSYIFNEGVTAIELGNPDALRQITKDHPLLVKFHDREGDTLMLHATKSAEPHMVKYLIEKGSDISAHSNDNDHAVTYVLGNDSLKDAEKIQVLDYLKKKGADFNAAGEFGERYPIDIASKELREKYVNEGAMDINLADNQGQTYLMRAIQRGADIECVKDAVALGANINQVDDDGRTAMHYAALKEDSGLYRSMSHMGGDTQINSASMTPDDLAREMHLNAEIKSGHVPNAQKDISYGAGNPEFEKYSSEVPWINACKSGGAAMAYIVVGDRTDLRSENGLTPMHYAAFGGDPAAIQHFADMGYDINDETSDFGWTALMEAQLGENALQSTQKLIEMGADVNIKTGEARTVISYVQDPKVYELIVNAGLDQTKLIEDERNMVRDVPVHENSHENDPAYQAWYESKYEDGGLAMDEFLDRQHHLARNQEISDLVTLMNKGDIEEFVRILNEDPKLAVERQQTYADETGKWNSYSFDMDDHVNGFHMEYENNLSVIDAVDVSTDPEFIEHLIKHGADVNSEYKGKTPIERVAGNAESTAMLVDAGADIYKIQQDEKRLEAQADVEYVHIQQAMEVERLSPNRKERTALKM
ncbi:ankyrin repeat domain-containing protein [Pseudoxanthomonas winnipegensis]|uniref:Uncharacterized protein n=1 Tax=Pseudoxanthomonas winnipegensis TaxID=2480810 RepID=A0A4Q8M4Z3_9GAMM|nr:ankyrin repeat domain-containing protein [Pseudoxanthomonas winnipegensis]TAA41564.1 hypothetical protein EA655_11520 [Pseudoxanthomonas winnipegensis]